MSVEQHCTDAWRSSGSVCHTDALQARARHGGSGLESLPHRAVQHGGSGLKSLQHWALAGEKQLLLSQLTTISKGKDINEVAAATGDGTTEELRR